MSRFDDQPTLTGATLTLCPFAAEHIDGLYAVARFPEVWAQHPASDRWRREVFEPYARFLLDAGGTLVATERESGRIIGCSRYYQVPDRPADIGIGFTFLAHEHWGGVTNREMKDLMLAHAFATFGTVWFHIGPQNTRSQIATTRLGAVWKYDAELDLGPGPSLTKCYATTEADWRGAQ